MPSESTALYTLVDPISPPSDAAGKKFALQRHVVEAPGTAPGSEWFITTAIYRHSQPKLTDNIYGLMTAKKRLIFLE